MGSHSSGSPFYFPCPFMAFKMFMPLTSYFFVAFFLTVAVEVFVVVAFVEVATTGL